MIATLIPLLDLYHLNTRLFLNCIGETTNDIAIQRPNGHTNNMLFLVCHLLDARFYLARLFGHRTKNPFQTLFDGINSVEDIKEAPQLADLRLYWMQLSAEIEPFWKKIDKEFLKKKSPLDVPMDKKDRLSVIAFLLHHEAYHIGQMALLRKYFGMEAMKY